MKRAILTLLALAGAATLHADPTPAPVPPAPATNDADAAAAQARSSALELAGAFSNDGYKIRDGFYFGDLATSKVIEVNLFAGNEYWFCAVANEPAKKISIQVFDEDGNLVKDQQPYEDGAKVAAGLVAGTSGKYLVKVAPVEGEKSQFAFVYCYK